MVDVCDGTVRGFLYVWGWEVWYGMVDVCDGYLAAEA